MSNQNYIFYGTKTNATDVRTFIEHNLKANELAEDEGKKRTPLCIWGMHGIGKTELVEAIARENNYQWAYIAPAQFEEMGDLVGMPKIIDGQTHIIPPEWVPQTEGPGIMLIDDVNRADDRILRGIMQLLQNFELISWKLPKKWHIILTANPDGGDYSVTPMDDAMLTRMMHITMRFDVKAWALWAEQHNVDQRGINFVLTYPEIVSEERTTPRTLVQFFNSISHIKDLEKELPLVQLLADSCLDSNAAISFISFIKNRFSKLITPEEILNSKDFDKEVNKYLESVCRKEVLRVDILATLCTRLMNYIDIKLKKIEDIHLDNIRYFIKMDLLPNDLRLTTLQEVVSSKGSRLKSIMNDPEIGKLLLSKM